jgi:hypothetical protein
MMRAIQVVMEEVIHQVKVGVAVVAQPDMQEMVVMAEAIIILAMHLSPMAAVAVVAEVVLDKVVH